jgi:predicted phosphohydrolase
MKIQIVSDLHLEFIRSELPEIQAVTDAIALVGDIGYPTKPHYREFIQDLAIKFKHVYVVAGNHEYYYSEYNEVNNIIQEICDTFSNVHFMNQKSIVYENENERVRIVGCTLWSFVDEDSRQQISRTLNDYSIIKIIDPETQQKRRLTVQDTNLMHAGDVAFIQRELEIAKQNDEKVIVLTHHAPLETGCSNPKFQDSPIAAAFQTPLEHLMGGNLKLVSH